MSWKVHLNLFFGAVFGCFLLGAFCGYRLSEGEPLIAFFVGAALGLCARFGFRALVLAHCPACDDPSARQVGSRPLAYLCGSCGHRHETNVYEGNNRL